MHFIYFVLLIIHCTVYFRVQQFWWVCTQFTMINRNGTILKLFVQKDFWIKTENSSPSVTYIFLELVNNLTHHIVLCIMLILNRKIFFLGKRRCPGEALAQRFITLIFANLVHDFVIEMDQSPDGVNSGIFLTPKPYKIKISERKWIFFVNFVSHNKLLSVIHILLFLVSMFISM